MLFLMETHLAVLWVGSWMGEQVLQCSRVLTGGLETFQKA